jgi:outer membrane protein
VNVRDEDDSLQVIATLEEYLQMKSFVVALVSLGMTATLSVGQTIPTASLELTQAESIALANQPRMLAAQLRARSSASRVQEARAGYFPTVTFSTTGVRVADTGSAVSAGALATSALSGRFAYGGSLTQIVTDFGRAGALVGAARYVAEAQSDIATLTRAQVRVNVRSSYYRTLGAEAVLRAAEAAFANRHVISQQLSALAASELRSTLDVNFAKVLESEAELAVVRAKSNVAQERLHLATSMGQEQPITVPLVDASTTTEVLPYSPEDLLIQAMAQRADLNALQAQKNAAQSFAVSEKRLSYPVLSLLGSAGQLPYHDHTLHDDYAAIGFNLTISVFNGGLFAARRREAELESGARSQDVQQMRLQVGEEVRQAWYRADEAYRSLPVTAHLVAQSKEALRLAQDRYDAGLGSIVELNEAQLNETSAEVTAADATYTYLTRRAQLDFVAGLLN